MVAIRIPKGWEIPEHEITPEAVYLNRRAFLRAMGFGGMGLVGRRRANVTESQHGASV